MIRVAVNQAMSYPALPPNLCPSCQASATFFAPGRRDFASFLLLIQRFPCLPACRQGIRDLGGQRLTLTWIVHQSIVHKGGDICRLARPEELRAR